MVNEGPKKPKATFGDVMLGRPSGQSSDSERPREKSAEARAPRRRERDTRPGGSGPVVVVKRAGATIETRTLQEQSSAPTASSGGTSEATAGAPEGAPEVSPAPVPVRAPSAIFEEVSENETFAEMFEASAKQEGGHGRRHYRVGEKVSGPVFQLGADMAFVTLPGKAEAMIELRELKDAEGILRSGVGDVVDAYVVEAGAKGIVLSRQMPKGAASLSRLAEARVTGLPVEGMVLSVNKGGLEIAVGDLRAFCPVSQIDVRFVDNPERFVGEKLMFRVMEVREKNVVLSRRALLEEEGKAKAAETRKELAPGKVLRGVVTSVRDFGAFVDLGGLEGMIPISELSYTRVKHASDVVKAGDEVEVEVLRMESAQPGSPDKAKHKERITLSMRSRLEDPWKVATEELQEGQELTGKIVRLQPFGAFVELRPGVDGLIHISALSNRRIAHPKDVVKVGDEVKVVVERIDPGEKRVSLRRVIEGEAGAPPPAGQAQGPAGATAEKVPAAPKPRVGQIVTGVVERIESFGLFVTFAGGRGLIPSSETGTDRGTDLKRTFKLGQELKAAVVEIEGGGKLRLSIPGAARVEERADLEAWKKSQNAGKGSGKGFGTLADLLKAKLGQSADES